MIRIKTLLCNLLWFVACVPGLLRFRRAVSNPKRAQTAILKLILRRNCDTEYGKKHGFGLLNGWDDFKKLPVTAAEDYTDAGHRIRAGERKILTSELVTILQPTSGSSSTPKLIPYTAGMAVQVRAALDAWVADLFMRYPKLLTGWQYWAISPANEATRDNDDTVPVGFLDDAEYFGAGRRAIVERVMAVPGEVRQIPSIDNNQYVTLLFLLRRQPLRLISVWHPSFLTLLIDGMRRNWNRLVNDIGSGGIHPDAEMPRELREKLSRQLPPMPRRQQELLQYRPDDPELCRRIWPGLTVISCWSDGAFTQDIAALREACPHAIIQAKGLMATEGVVSIPFHKENRHVCAASSHFLEFEDARGVIYPLWKLESGKVYEIILTTAGGHYRYRLGDRVEVTGYVKKTPCIRFLGRAGVVSDCVGEKLHIEHVEEVLAELREEFALGDRLAMLVPVLNGGKPRYKLLLEQVDSEASEPEGLVATLERRLCNNYHYEYARELGQLEKVVVEPVPAGAKRRYRDCMIKGGALAGTVKFPALCKNPRDIEAVLA